MTRRVLSLGYDLIFTAFAVLSLIPPTSAPGQGPPKPPAVTEENDGLPSDLVGPSRKELITLIRAIGRDPVSDELVDRVEAIFRPRWATLGNFETVKKNLADPAFVAKVDAASKEVAKAPADTWTLIHRASKHYAGEDEPAIQEALRQEIAWVSGEKKAIKGRILDDETGKPIVGAVLTTAGRFLARTDEKGDYALKVAKPVGGNLTNFAITVEAPGYALTQTGLGWEEMPEAQTLDFRVPPSVVFGGRVVDSESKPVAGVDLVLYVRIDPISRDGTMMRLGLGGAVQFRARTDAGGNYAFRNVPPDFGPRQAAYNLSVSHPKYQPRRKIYNQNELLGPGWEITLEDGFTVRGRLVDDEGKAVPNASLMAMSQPVTGSYPAATTDADGRFSFDSLPQGPVQILVRPVGFVYKRVEAQAEKGDPAETTITVEKGEYFEGKVVDAEDKPVVGATVGYLQPVNDEGVIQQNNVANLGSPNTRTAKDGTFKLGPVAKGKYRIMAIRNQPNVGQTNGAVHADSGAKDVVIKMGMGPGIQ